MDEEGNAVACTETINLTFGSFVVVPEFGILLNNQMDDFAANPGKANAFGLIQGAANAIAPGKRPLSSMTPTIIIEDGKATYACGASGGPRIITATLQNLLNHTVFGIPVDQAVAAPRFHHQWSPDELLHLECGGLTPLWNSLATAFTGNRASESRGVNLKAPSSRSTPKSRFVIVLFRFSRREPALLSLRTSR